MAQADRPVGHRNGDNENLNDRCANPDNANQLPKKAPGGADATPPGREITALSSQMGPVRIKKPVRRKELVFRFQRLNPTRRRQRPV
jgi:hypothetical protein